MATNPTAPPSSGLEDSTLHVIAAVITVVLGGGMLGGAVVLSGIGGSNHEEEGPNLDDMEVIEATLAYKKPTPKKQPQKPMRAPNPEVKPDGVSHDADKPVTEPKDEPDKPKKPDDLSKVLDQYKRPNDDEDLDVGKPKEEDLGEFDGSDFGWAESTKGDPYFVALVSDLREGWEYPEISPGDGVPVVCIHLEPDGKIPETDFKEKSGNAELDDSVERQLSKLEKKRGEHPRPVPDNLLKLTRKWICFRMKV
jgi:hypothetical protein